MPHIFFSNIDLPRPAPSWIVSFGIIPRLQGEVHLPTHGVRRRRLTSMRSNNITYDIGKLPAKMIFPANKASIEAWRIRSAPSFSAVRRQAGRHAASCGRGARLGAVSRVMSCAPCWPRQLFLGPWHSRGSVRGSALTSCADLCACVFVRVVRRSPYAVQRAIGMIAVNTNFWVDAVIEPWLRVRLANGSHGWVVVRFSHSAPWRAWCHVIGARPCMPVAAQGILWAGSSSGQRPGC